MQNFLVGLKGPNLGYNVRKSGCFTLITSKVLAFYLNLVYYNYLLIRTCLELEAGYRKLITASLRYYTGISPLT